MHSVEKTKIYSSLKKYFVKSIHCKNDALA